LNFANCMSKLVGKFKKEGRDCHDENGCLFVGKKVRSSFPFPRRKIFVRSLVIWNKRKIRCNWKNNSPASLIRFSLITLKCCIDCVLTIWLQTLDDLGSLGWKFDESQNDIGIWINVKMISNATGTVNNQIWKFLIKQMETKWNASEIVWNGEIVQIKLTNPCNLQIHFFEKINNCFKRKLELRIKPSVWIKLDQTEECLDQKINHHYKNIGFP
jgi:hypothetical protein